MQKRFYLMMLLISIVTSINAQEHDSKKEKRRVGGSTRLIAPTLTGAQKEKELNKKKLTIKERHKHKEAKTKKREELRTKKVEEKKKDKEQKAKKERLHSRKKRSTPPVKAHVIMANVHELAAKESDIRAKKIKHHIHHVRHATKKIEDSEKKRLASISREKKERALLNARHAETEKDQKIHEYISCRMHGTCEHPALKPLRKKHKHLGDALKKEHKIKNYHNALAEDNYKKVGFNSINKQNKAKKREHHIIHGKLSKRTRKNLNETSEQIARKRKIEERRKQHESKYHTIIDNKKRHHSNSKKEIKIKNQEIKEEQKNPIKKLHVVIQKKSKK